MRGILQELKSHGTTTFINSHLLGEVELVCDRVAILDRGKVIRQGSISELTRLQGVFVIRNKKAEFVPVETGVTGTTDIEVLKGLKEGDQIITGSYKVLRTLRPGASIKVDNSAPKKQEEGS